MTKHHGFFGWGASCSVRELFSNSWYVTFLNAMALQKVRGHLLNFNDFVRHVMELLRIIITDMPLWRMKENADKSSQFFHAYSSYFPR